jgi:hypothetical protein
MASLTTSEFYDAVGALAEHFGVEQLRDKLATIGAFQSRKGLTSASAIADRLRRLSGGLKLPVAATYAFTHLWSQMLGAKLGGEDNEKALEALAEKVNACLDEKEHVVAGKEGDLDQAIAEYREAVSKAMGPKAAHCDMILKSVPAVAERVRASGPAS